MTTRKFRFKKSYFTINGVHNIPGFIICGGHGYDLKTYCCKICGEIFVVDLELLYSSNKSLQMIIEEKICPKCNGNLETNLIEYPENIFYNNLIMKNNMVIDNLNIDKTELLDVYIIE